MADDSGQQRKSDFRTAVEDGKALATVLIMKLESVLGRRLKLRSPAVLAAIGVIATLVLALLVILILQLTGDTNAVSDNAAVIGALLALGGVGTAQMVSIALDQRRTQHEALQAYLAKMSELLLDKCLHEKEADFDPARVTARLQTLAVLERLDAERKRTVLLFLREAQLINRDNRLETTNGREVHFYAHYVGLRGADLSGANLSDLRLTSALGKYPVSLSGANLNDANLSRATLSRADLSGADLSGADLSEADLSEADLSRAFLIGADLSAARGITIEKLAQQAYSLGVATMPNGQKYEEWLKSRGEGDSATPEQRGPWWGGPYHRPWWRRMFDA